eukprot:6187420-Pleurochrysis_carterae.AAC.5
MLLRMAKPFSEMRSAVLHQPRMVCPDMFQCHALIFHPLGSAARDFNKNIRAAAAANKNSPNQQTNTGGRDPYGIFKEAILSKPDEQQVQAVAREDEETRRLRRKHMSRNALREVRMPEDDL